MGSVVSAVTGGGAPKRDKSQDRIIAAQEEQLAEAREERQRVESERAARKRRREGAKQGLGQLAFRGDTGTQLPGTTLGAGGRSSS